MSDFEEFPKFKISIQAQVAATVDVNFVKKIATLESESDSADEQMREGLAAGRLSRENRKPEALDVRK
jgi:hypothetical protein